MSFFFFNGIRESSKKFYFYTFSLELCTSEPKTDISIRFYKQWLIITSLFMSLIIKMTSKVHCPPKVKVQPALLFSSFVHDSSINELKNMKLSEHVCYEMINWILCYYDFKNSL